MPRPQPGSYPAYFQNYIKLVDAESGSEAIEKYGDQIVELYRQLPEDKASYSYAEGKWTLKEMLLHVVDTERIFAYRALRIARGDQTPLPGFDENDYAANSYANTRSWHDLLAEFKAVRTSTDLLLRSFSQEQLQKTGTTNNNPTTVNSIVFVVYGHLLHHLNVIKERYL